jgi:hypothetical protein
MAFKPPIATGYLGSAERFAVVTTLAADLDCTATYGSLPRKILVLGGGGATNLVVTQTSPYDDTGAHDVQTIPVYQGLELHIMPSVIHAATTALPLLLMF